MVRNPKLSVSSTYGGEITISPAPLVVTAMPAMMKRSRNFPLLAAEMRKSVAHWGAGDVDHPIERLVEFQDQEDRA